jgi:hypothetical protein
MLEWEPVPQSGMPYVHIGMNITGVAKQYKKVYICKIATFEIEQIDIRTRIYI